MQITSRYIVHKIIGSGGMGTVYEAFDRLNNRNVALKQVKANVNEMQFVSEKSSSNRLISMSHEFSVLATLRHPHIISVFDYGVDDMGFPYYTMEYIPNAKILTDVVVNASQDKKLSLLIDMMEALAYLHNRGVIHRDLKPSNVLITETNQLKVMDFGLALSPDISTREWSKLAGTMAYIAPEMFSDQPASIQSDLYAVGVIIYQLFAGHHPFNKQNMATLLSQILAQEPDFQIFDDEIQTIVRPLLAKDPTDRPEKARDVLAQLYNIHQTATQSSNHEQIRESYLQAAPFVGREQIMEQLQTGWHQVKTGGNQFFLIGGEAGIGKTRLIDEFRIRVLVDSAYVLRGQGSSEGALYSLWKSIIQQLVLSSQISDQQAIVLKDIVPDIRTLLKRDIIGDPSPLKGDAYYLRLVNVLKLMLQQQTKPIVILLEDLHFVNESIEILRHLLSFSNQLNKIMIVATFRNDEPLTSQYDLIQMEMTYVHLKRLETEDITKLSQDMLQYSVADRQFMTLLEQETEGNTFFIVEVVRQFIEETGNMKSFDTNQLPRNILTDGMQQLLKRRLNRLP